MGKYAVCLNAGPDDVGSAVNGLEYARSLSDAGHEVAVFLDGPASRWPGEATARPEHPVSDALTELRARGVLEGACAYCADAYDATDGCEAAGVTLLGTAGRRHAPDVGELATDGYELLTVG